MLSVLIQSLGVRFDSLSAKYLELFFDAANTDYAEVCGALTYPISF
jgi:hypothetical protein